MSKFPLAGVNALIPIVQGHVFVFLALFGVLVILPEE